MFSARAQTDQPVLRPSSTPTYSVVVVYRVTLDTSTTEIIRKIWQLSGFSLLFFSEDGAGGMGAGGGGGGQGFEFGVDPNEDPELALALRVSMEEQRAR